MIVLGLTGSIGMGKTAAARSFAALGIPVFEADAVVHELLGPGGAAVAAVGGVFPTALVEDHVDRSLLGALVFNDPNALRRLEAILHPLVRARERKFRRAAAASGAWIAVLDIPLLFEAGAAARCDYVAVVSAPAGTQRARVLRRPAMTDSRYRAVLAQQMSDRAKRRRADFVIDTGAGRRRTLQRIRAIIRMLRVAGHSGRRRWGRARRLDAPPHASTETNARSRPRYRDNRARSARRPSHRRDRLRRAAQPHPDRRDLPALPQPRA